MFKPDRDKLNANFEGYRLGRSSLTCVSQSFSEEVRVARLKGEDFGYQHVRAFSLCNHLVVDPWDPDSVYWCAGNGSVLRGRYLGPAGVEMSTVYQFPERLAPAPSSVNPSLSFLTNHHCLLTSGCSSTLYLLHTPPRTVSNTSGDRASENKVLWKLAEELKLPETNEEPVSVLSAHYSETEHQLNVATMILHHSTPNTSSGKESGKEPSTKPPVATYNWYCCSIDLRSPLPSGSQIEKQSEKGTKLDLVCSLQSSTVALCGTFVTNHLIVLSEANILPVGQPTPVESDKQPEEETGRADLKRIVEMLGEGEEDKSGEKFAGLGFERRESSEEPQYKWDQTESDVTITVALPDDVTKSDVRCVIERGEVVVGLSDGTTFLRGQLFAPVTPDCSTWTIENHTLEVSLEKEKEGQWTTLTVQEGEGEGGSDSTSVRGPVADQLSSEELQDLRRKVAEATKEGTSPEASSLVQGMFYEECDLNEEDATFFIITPSTTTPQRVPLAGRQFLFSSPSLPQTPPLVCLKHDVDAILWQPQAPPTTTDSSTISWTHVGTFNALAYVQAARQDKKFTVCPPNMKFAALCDCSRHVFVYLQPEEGVSGNTADQYVTTLKSQEDILGLGATDSGLVFVLKEHELHVIVVS